MTHFLPVLIGKNSVPFTESEVKGKFCIVDGKEYYMIENVNEMCPFFMSIVSASNHWMFISSNGALSAGRKNADFALFPYYTDDKITESAETTGSKTILIVRRNNENRLWEPFSEKYEGIYAISRNLYKNTYGNKIIFEEINRDLGLTFRYQWNSSNEFGFVRKSTLINHASDEVKISVLDGLQNIMPYGVPSDVQNATSNLVDAYKRSELIHETGVGIFALSAIIVDKPEPAEALKANIVWSLGLENPVYLLSSAQLKNFRKGISLTEETDVKGEKGAYFVHSEIVLSAKTEKQWLIVANVNQNHSSIIHLSEQIKNGQNLSAQIQKDIEQGTRNLTELVASADGLQLTADKLKDTRHFSNTLFNIMRGGVFDFNYRIEKQDFIRYLSNANKEIVLREKAILEQLPTTFNLPMLNAVAEKTDSSDFKRLCVEYLPLMFSRRHGDPSRPWNKFSINTHSEIDGSKVLDYQGNWRDIFQNWETLAHSYPEFADGMIHKFLNATTFEGYNPYRVTKDGFDWETIEPDNPWSYIGYWGDHQIIYLLRLLELLENYHPHKLANYFDKSLFVYANVPYKIKSYGDILKNPKDTIEFDEKSDRKIRQKREIVGADAALLTDRNGQIHKVNFIEKILATVLAKLSNFIPEGGIWMNTQRPEWNDANNALVGNGVSMVTLYYLRSFLHFFKTLLAHSHAAHISLSEELADCFTQMSESLEKYANLLENSIKDTDRKRVLDALAQPASDYRTKIYEQSFSGGKKNIGLSDLTKFVEVSIRYLEHSIRANKREDDLYHAYNLMTLKNEREISVSYLSEMLEGQVAVLSSGYLSSEEAVKLLDSLKQSKLFREDQHSYILYPNKNLPRFLEKNTLSEKAVLKSKMLQKWVLEGDTRVIEKDVNGHFHFNGNFKNANDLKTALENVLGNEHSSEKEIIVGIFEEIFNHKAFTGRSGTFYAYEGLGSIYWHMVSKLQLAVQEYCLKSSKNNESEEVKNRLSAHYCKINEGIGVHKSPTVYGAFPTDPYSHTPAGKGAKQPGMTGQVKEDILSRFGELGVSVSGGKIAFNPCLLKKEEMLSQSKIFRYIDVNQQEKEIALEKESLGFTRCQTPVIYKMADKESVKIDFSDDNTLEINDLNLSEEVSKMIFERSGKVQRVTVYLKKERLLSFNL